MLVHDGFKDVPSHLVAEGGAREPLVAMGPMLKQAARGEADYWIALSQPAQLYHKVQKLVGGMGCTVTTNKIPLDGDLF